LTTLKIEDLDEGRKAIGGGYNPIWRL